MFQDLIFFMDTIGFYGPLIIALCVIIALMKRPTYIALYILFFGLNNELNKLLKSWFREERPSSPIPFSRVEKYSGVQFYGMPSGHAQSAGFSVVFLSVLEGYYSWWLYIIAAIMGLTCIQRWKYRRHTVEQIMAGLFFGGTFAWIVLYVFDDYSILRIRKWMQ
jgi:membrane-associated phospholipid phosphatase